MGKKEKLKQQVNSIEVSSEEDEEANEDLSLKIVEKSMLRACGRDAVLDESKSVTSQVVMKKKKKKKKKNKNKKNTYAHVETQVDIAKRDAQLEGTLKSIKVDESIERNPVEIPDNVVLRKLLRGPRYFDPPDSGWGACYNCGEEGHTTVNCTSAKRRKPCFVCGSLDHNAKQCRKGQDCFICKKGGHRAKDCPEKHTSFQNAKICLKCGHSGHEMFSCKNDYSPEDLKEIQCYMCKSFGHLCCVNYTGTVPRDVSCYRCGQSGHTGLACSGLRGETNDMGILSSCYRCGEEGHFARECTISAKAYTGFRGETNDMGSPSSCYRCGEGGHFERECPSSAKSVKRNHESSTPTRKYRKENRAWLEARSAPLDLGKVRKRKKPQYDTGFITSPKSEQKGGWITEHPGDYPRRNANSFKSKQRGGWITEDPGYFPRRKGKENGWGSPSTPTNRNYEISSSAGGVHTSTSRSRKGLYFENSVSNGSNDFYQQGYSMSRFSNYSSDGMRRNYDW